MQKRHLLTLIVSVLLLSGCSQIPFLNQQKAAVLIDSTPTATVFLNDTHIGQTPIDNRDIKPDEYVLKLQVDNDPNKVWQTNITLSPQIVTVINRDFGDNENQSSNYILQLEPLDDAESTQVSIITDPDQAVVKIDGQPEGFSPVVLRDSISPGDHTISIVKPGYQEQVIAAQVQAGYKLLVTSQLAQSIALNQPQDDSQASPSAQIATPSADIDDELPDEEEVESEPSPSPTAAQTSQSTSSEEVVEILETGTGWLRVRSEPNASLDNEVARVDVGETYPFIEQNETGWYLIEYEAGEEGWISGRYAQILEE